MYYGEIKNYDIANGEGVRVTLFVSDGAHPRGEVTDELLSLVDVLVDGRFVEELHDISLRFRGSSNQRIIDVPRTLSSGGITLWEDQ